MKLLMVGPQVPMPADDGGRLAMLSIVRSLRADGIEVHFVAPRVKANDAGQFSREVVLHLVDYDPRSTIAGRMRSFFTPLPYSVEKFFSRQALSQIEEIVRRVQPEIVHAETLFMARFGLALKKVFDFPVVLREQNVESELLRHFRDAASNPAVRLYAHSEYLKMARFEADMVRRCDAVLPITDEDARKIEALAAPRRCVVVPFGVDTDRLVFAHRFVADRVLFLTNFDWIPNRQSFAFYRDEIHPEIVARRPRIRTLVVGKALQRAEAGALPASIEMRGFVKDINEVSALASIAIVPLRIGSGVRVKILELMAMGVVVVTTSRGLEGIEARDGEHVIIADEPGAIAERIDQLLADRSTLQRIALAARKLVEERYSPLAVGKTLTGVYRSLLSKKGPRVQ